MPENENYQADQGTIVPRIFIGLGGAGSRIVDRIAGRTARLENWDEQLRPLTHFVSIDTNELDQHKLKFIPSGNCINIAAFDKSTVIENFRRSNDQQALQWIDKAYQPRPGYKPGAGQIRIESRLGFFYYSTEIRERLRNLVEDSLRANITWRQSNPPKVDVYLFCSLAGGTGSGSFLSAAYLIDEIINEQHWQPRVIGNLLLSTMMTGKVGSELHADIHANTYAALKELENLTKLDYKQVKDEGRTEEEFVYCRNPNNPEITKVKTSPFFISFIFDRPQHLSLDDSEAAVADTSFLQVFTPLIVNFASELDNYEKKMGNLTHLPGKLSDVGLGYTKNFGAYGAAVMVLPGEELLEYCSLRFAAQALRRQITFSLDEADANDDRAVALALLAVNYEDPKFLRMSDEDRERTINKAFVACVQELARQDIAMELPQGAWAQLVESADEGKFVGLNEQGLPIRNESLANEVERKFKEGREIVLNKVSIKERAFTFHKEGISQYIEFVSRLSDEIRAASAIVDESLQGLEKAAKQGELVSQLKLDPLTERYLIIRLLDLCEKEWIPAAQTLLDKAATNDINNAKVRERLEREMYANLQEAAAKKDGFRNKQEDFLNARDEAQSYYRGVAAAAKKNFEAKIRLRQLRALLEYLQKRSKQYANLSSRMEVLVTDLERKAERLRRGEIALSPAFALRVEVFETLEEPRQRIWDKVFKALFIDEGRYISTFDRQVLAATITQELKPIVLPNGAVADKSINQLVIDLEKALCELGKERLRPAILGNNNGLDLVRGLELEAQLILKAKKPTNEIVSDKEVAEYRKKKFRALEQLAGTLARVNIAEANSLDDGVIFNSTRQLIIGQVGENTGASQNFKIELENILKQSAKTVNTDYWYDPRFVIVRDVKAAIPLYYFPAVVGDIEAAYIQQAQDEKRAYNLHTDKNWEKSLPNLNPRRSEITVDWTLKTLAKALILRVVIGKEESYIWLFKDETVRALGTHLSMVLYELEKMHNNPHLREKMEERLKTAQEEMSEEGSIQARQNSLLEKLDKKLTSTELSELDGKQSREDILDRPIIRALIAILKQGVDMAVDTSSSTKASSHILDLD